MPRYTTDVTRLEKYIQSLVVELRRPALPGPPELVEDAAPGGPPVIIEEPTYQGRIGVTVIWDGWRDLSGEVRGRVILEAYRRALGSDEAQKVGIAMGFTNDQYARIRAQAG